MTLRGQSSKFTKCVFTLKFFQIRHIVFIVSYYTLTYYLSLATLTFDCRDFERSYFQCILSVLHIILCVLNVLFCTSYIYYTFYTSYMYCTLFCTFHMYYSVCPVCTTHSACATCTAHYAVLSTLCMKQACNIILMHKTSWKHYYNA